MSTTIEPTEAQRAVLARYLEELDLWSRRLNLTTVPREARWQRHVGESLALLAAAALPEGSRCADLGSGAGLPGIPIAITRPDLRVVLVEADQRKAGFLVHVCGLLDLGNVTVLAMRAEEMARDPGHARAHDAVVSRAAAPPARLWRLARPLLRPGGVLWALAADADIDLAEPALRRQEPGRVARPAPGVLAVQAPTG